MPDTLVHYLRWLSKGRGKRKPAKPATLERRVASIVRMHLILGFGGKDPLPTQAGMVRDMLKALRHGRRERQRQAASLRFGTAMSAAEPAQSGVTILALFDSCGDDMIGLRDAALRTVGRLASIRPARSSWPNIAMMPPAR